MIARGGPIQLELLLIADWAYSIIFAATVQFQISDQFWIPHLKLHKVCFLLFYRKISKQVCYRLATFDVFGIFGSILDHYLIISSFM